MALLTPSTQVIRPLPGHTTWDAPVRTRWTWLTEADSLTSVRVDEPISGECVGALVIIPAIARERVVSFRSLRTLAIRAAQCGFVVVSVDVAGEGDTPGLTQDGDLAAAWRANVAAGMAFARARTSGPVHVIGLRMGAGLASEVPGMPGEIRLLWEPIAGSAWLRQMRALRRFAIAQQPVADGVELHDMHLREGEARSLALITLPGTDVIAASTVLSLRRETDRSVADRLATASPHQSSIPHAVLDEIVAALPRGENRPGIAWTPFAQAMTRPGVTEIHCLIGGRHALLTVPTQVAVTQTFAFTAIGSELSTGPGAMWAEGARLLALRGAASLRVDRRALGEALDPRQVTEPLPYTDQAVADTEEQIEDLRQRFPGVPLTGIGACAGAWCFLRAAGSGELDRVVAINQIHWAPNESHYGRAFYVRAYGEEGRLPRRLGPMRAPGLTTETGVVALLKKRYRARRHLVARDHPRAAILTHRTDYGDRVWRMLRRVPDGVAVDLLLGEWEYGLFLGKGGGRYLRRNGRGISLNLSVSTTLDHSLCSEGARREVLAHLVSLLR